MAELDDNADIETGADTLLNFLDQKNKWPVSKIADEMGVPEKTVKAWAKALEKSGLVEIKYSAIKGMVLEYSSEKSYEELSEGSSEVAIEADEIEIEAEEVETIETEEAEEKEDSEIPSKTIHREETGEKSDESPEEDKSESKEETEENGDENEEKVEEQEKESEIEDKTEEGTEEPKNVDGDLEDEEEEETEDDGETGKNSEKDENNDDAQEDNIDEAEGKEKLKNKLEDLEDEKKKRENEKAKLKADKAKLKKQKKEKKNSDKKSEKSTKNDSEDAEGSKAKLKAEKARIKGGKRKETVHSEKKTGYRERHEEKIEDFQESLGSKEKKEVEHESGESLDDILDNLEELGEMLKDDEFDRSEIYGRMEQETEELVELLKDIKIGNEEKSKIADTMETVHSDLEAVETTSLLDKILSFFTSSGEKDEDSHEGRVEDLHGQVSSRKGAEVDHVAGEDFYEVTDSIKELGDMLHDEDVDNEEVYSRLDSEMRELKNILETERITRDMKHEIYDTMTKVENDISMAEGGNSSKSILDRLKELIT